MDAHTVDAIDAQIARREAAMTQLREEIESLRGARAIFLDDGPDDSPTPPVNSDTLSIASTPKPDTIGKEMYGAIFPMLYESGEKHRSDIMERLRSMGIHLPGDTPEQRTNYVGGFLRHGVQWNGLTLKSMAKEDPRLRGYWAVEGEPTAPITSPEQAPNCCDESGESRHLQPVASSNDKSDGASDNRHNADCQ